MVMEKIQGKEQEERKKKVGKSKYNDTYKNIVTEEFPEYLKRKKKKKDRRHVIARCRYGNELRENQWEGGGR